MSSARLRTVTARDGPAGGETDPRAHVNRVVARSGTSFLWGMRVLPAERRHAMYAIYAFCREVDDIADEPGEVADKRRALAAWREEIDRLYAGRPEWLTTRALQAPVRRFELPREEFLAIIDGMEIDAAPTVRMRRLPDLLDYCRKVAGSVGILSVHTFGVPMHPGPRIAEVLGNALQLTNILRDLKEDAALQRLYVPQEMLDRHGVAGRNREAEQMPLFVVHDHQTRRARPGGRHEGEPVPGLVAAPLDDGDAPALRCACGSVLAVGPSLRRLLPGCVAVQGHTVDRFPVDGHGRDPEARLVRELHHFDRVAVVAEGIGDVSDGLTGRAGTGHARSDRHGERAEVLHRLLDVVVEALAGVRRRGAFGRRLGRRRGGRGRRGGRRFGCGGCGRCGVGVATPAGCRERRKQHAGEQDSEGCQGPVGRVEAQAATGGGETRA